jgi:hypothetical protein
MRVALFEIALISVLTTDNLGQYKATLISIIF